ncbi:MAG TPA: DNA repair protein RecN [Candidatus Tumulicola sp.]|nr:DNA repair protein RecN [Candidatus Tumulicola sp.]
MLSRLEIENYGLIARARIEFGDGATIFTGETGSGKTMLIGALAFVLGERAGADVVRRGAAKAVTSLWFDPSDALRERFAADGFALDPGEDAAIAREMTEAGRSSVRVNGRPATAAYVRELADGIAEIVGQHEAQRLLAPAYHRELLDAFAGVPAMRARAAVAHAYAAEQERLRAIELMRSDEAQAQRRYEDARFACEEIDSARPQPGETGELQQRRRRLENAAQLTDALRRANAALDEERGAIGLLGEARAALSAISEVAPRFKAMSAAAAAVQSQANDLAADVAGAVDDELDPAELDAINARLDVLERLERKYGGSVEAVLAHGESARAAVDAFESRERREAELGGEIAAARRELDAAASQLSALRGKAAAALTRALKKELAELALGAGCFEVALEPLDRTGPDGAERVEFLFAANAGEPARPLARVASGGELSRLLLALIVALANARCSSAALVFDEIDAGIGGATATAVGARIGRLAESGQVLCVTHLAQLATWAQRHYVLEKSESRTASTIAVREIAGSEARAEELARMLSGEKHEIALQHARSLLAKTKKRTA